MIAARGDALRVDNFMLFGPRVASNRSAIAAHRTRTGNKGFLGERRQRVVFFIRQKTQTDILDRGGSIFFKPF
jgi:hypothetical protein